MAKPKIRDNFGRFQKQATINVTKKLAQVAENVEVDIIKVVEDKLLETYKNNVLLSYGPRSSKGREVAEYNKKAKEAEEADKQTGINARHRRKKLTYRHTNTFINAIQTEVEGNKIKIVLNDNTYPNGKSVAEVYKYLTEGTMGGGTYTFMNEKGETKWAYNYPTPAHLFEEHTKIQMQGFLENLDLNEYTHVRRYKLKKRR